MAFATAADANAWLDEAKVKFVDDADAAKEGENAEKIIKGMLAPVYGDELDDWDAGEAVPELIKVIAEQLMAAYRLQKLYALTNELNPRATELEARAMSMLTGLANGTISLYDKTYEQSALTFTREQFYPNSLGPLDDADEVDRKFTMDAEF